MFGIRWYLSEDNYYQERFTTNILNYLVKNVTNIVKSIAYDPKNNYWQTYLNNSVC